MNFFIWKKNFVLFSRYVDFSVLWNPQILKSVTSSQALLYNGNYTYAYFFWIPSTVKIKFGQIQVCCMTNTLIMFLAYCWRLETSCRPFYGFIKMTIQQDLIIFNSWHLPFLIVAYSLFQKNETLDSWHYWLLSNWSRLLNCKGPGT